MQTDQANRRRQLATKFIVGDKVILDLRNISTKRPNKSLDYKNLGPLEIIKSHDTAYELKLLESMKSVYPMFYP